MNVGVHNHVNYYNSTDECNLFLLQLHAARSGHSNFSESTEEIKPLTEDEKKQQQEMYGSSLLLRLFLVYKNFS